MQEVSRDKLISTILVVSFLVIGLKSCESKGFPSRGKLEAFDLFNRLGSVGDNRLLLIITFSRINRADSGVVCALYDFMLENVCENLYVVRYY